MAVLRLVGLSLVAGLLLVAVGVAPARPTPRHSAAAPPTSLSSRYAVPYAGPVLRVGGTVYVGGVSRVAAPTGSAAVVSAATGRAEPVAARITGGSVKAAVADGAGGWYIGGDFTSVGGLPRPGLAHLLANGALDTAFAPPALGWVNALALDAGRLYVGGTQPPTGAAWFVPFLNALDPATGALLPVSYPPLAKNSGGPFDVVGLAAAAGKLFVAFNSANGIAAYDGSSGTLLWSQPGSPSETLLGPAALALAGGRVLVSGEISTATGPVELEELDPATGNVVGAPAVDGPIRGITTVADTAYIVARSGRRGSIWKLDVASGTLTRRAACHVCSTVATDGTTLYVAKRPAGADQRVYTLDLSQAKPHLRALSQAVVGGSVNALALQGGRLFVGGWFLGLGGVERSGLAAFDARTGALLPWRPIVQQGDVSALGHSGKTIYVGGDFGRVNGKRRDGLAAVSARGKGKLLPWHPLLSHADIGSLAVAGGRVFAGGALEPHGAKPSAPLSSLLAFSATTGKRLAFKPRPQIDGLQILAVWHELLLVGSAPSQGSPAGVTALRVHGDGRSVWSQSVMGGTVPIVFALQTDGSTLYVGGRFTEIGGQARTNLAALALDRSGAVLDFGPQIPNQVMALAKTDYGLVFSTMTISGPTWLGTQALGAVSADGQLLPWQIDYPPSNGLGDIEHLAVVSGGGLVASGGFSWIGPSDDPAPGGVVWIR